MLITLSLVVEAEEEKVAVVLEVLEQQLPSLLVLLLVLTPLQLVPVVPELQLDLPLVVLEQSLHLAPFKHLAVPVEQEQVK
jgi:hypothetical protein